MVRAKFQVLSNENGLVKMYPVYADTDENRTFWQSTPSGMLEMNLVSPETAARFEAGKAYYLDFTPAEG